MSVVIFLATCWQQGTYPRTTLVLLWCLPILAVILGVLMVSNVRYEHALNHLIRKRRPISHLVLVVLGLALVVVLGLALAALLWHVFLLVGFGGYVLSGPLGDLYRRWKCRGQALPPEAEGPEEEFASEEE